LTSTLATQVSTLISSGDNLIFLDTMVGALTISVAATVTLMNENVDSLNSTTSVQTGSMKTDLTALD
jgi:hypothetical protein